MPGVLFGGPTPIDGLSAYQIAVNNGFIGTEAQWITSLMGAPGLSAYQQAQSNGFTGTLAQWLASLVGPPGDPGPAGPSGIATLTLHDTTFGMGTSSAPYLTDASGQWVAIGKLIHVSGKVTYSQAGGQFILPAACKFGLKGILANVFNNSAITFQINPNSNILSYGGSAYNTPVYFALNFLTV